MEECGIVMYCDLHAHSRKHNVFIYGCENKRYVEKRLQEQVFPLMLHKNAADKVKKHLNKFPHNIFKRNSHEYFSEFSSPLKIANSEFNGRKKGRGELWFG